MAQQPNIELDAADAPRQTPTPDPARRWNPGMRPGVIASPSDKPIGSGFGTPGPDAGWALTLIRRADLDDSSPELEALLAAIMVARASHFGRAPVPDDLEAAMILCGLDDGAHSEHVERGQRWKTAVSHDKPKGRTALAELSNPILTETPARIRVMLGDELISQ